MSSHRIVLLLLAFAFAFCGGVAPDAWAKKKGKDVKIIRPSETMYKKVKVVRSERIQKKRFFWHKKDKPIAVKTQPMKKTNLPPAEAKAARALALETKVIEPKKRVVPDETTLKPATAEGELSQPTASRKQLEGDAPVTRPKETLKKKIVDPDAPVVEATEKTN